jgi:hypothetical protein
MSDMKRREFTTLLALKSLSTCRDPARAADEAIE